MASSIRFRRIALIDGHAVGCSAPACHFRPGGLPVDDDCCTQYACDQAGESGIINGYCGGCPSGHLLIAEPRVKAEHFDIEPGNGGE